MTERMKAWKLVAVAVALGAVSLFVNTAASHAESQSTRVERGKYLVHAIGCADCHTPLVMGSKGPERDASRYLAGHPEDLVMPAAPALPPGPWGVIASATVTAWSGPWGTSFTANLTPDRETGLGNWTSEQFIEAIRTKRHLGRGRPLLPPMPAEFYANLEDEDLRSVFAYLQTIPPVRNRVPEPLPPAESM